MSITIITSFDVSTNAIYCFMMWYGFSFDFCLKMFHYVGCFCVVIYLACVAESPVYLLLRYGERDNKEAISILNYISWFNGSDFRIPENSTIEVDQPLDMDDSVAEIAINATRSVVTF